LVFERLQQTHDSLQAYRPRVDAAAILGEPPVPELGGLFPQPPCFRLERWPEMVASDPIPYEMDHRPKPLTWEPRANLCGDLAFADLVSVPLGAVRISQDVPAAQLDVLDVGVPAIYPNRLAELSQIEVPEEL